MKIILSIAHKAVNDDDKIKNTVYNERIHNKPDFKDSDLYDFEKMVKKFILDLNQKVYKADTEKLGKKSDAYNEYALSCIKTSSEVVDSILNFFLPDEYSLLTCVAVTNDNKYFTAGFENGTIQL